MSMFSIHYVIFTKQMGYWTGGPPLEASSWDPTGRRAVRIFAHGDAEAICKGVLREVRGLTIEEDE